MIKKRILLTTLITVVSILLFDVVPVAAQSTGRESITVSPTSRQYKVNAGKTLTDKLTVINDGTVDYDFLVYARPFAIVDNNYDNPSFTKVTERGDLYGWVQFPQTRFHLKAGDTQEVAYTITVPAGVAPGGHYGVIFVETQPPQNSESGNAVIRKKRVGSIMYTTVNGSYREEGKAMGGEIPFWQVQPPLTTTVSVQNTGNTDFTDTTRLTVRDVFGNKKYESVKDYQVLPETTRTMTLEWEKAPWFGFYKVETEQKFLDSVERYEGYVLIMPRFMPVALLVVIAIGALYAWARRRKS